MHLIPIFKPGIWNAWLFMSVFLFQMIPIMFFNKRIREKSHIPANAKSNRTGRYSGFIANLTWLLALVYSVFLPLMFGSICFFIGLIIFCIGLIIITIATINFITTSPDQLIAKGVYRYSRHPMYLSTFFICLGSGIASGSGIFILITGFMAWCFHMEALVEEKYCLEKYHNAYQEYMDKVPRWIGFTSKPVIL